MKLVPIKEINRKPAPPWIKLHPVSGMIYVDEHRSDCFPKRITRSTGSKDPREALRLGEDIRSAWMAADAAKVTRDDVTLRDLCREVLANKEAAYERGKLRIGTLENCRVYLKVIADEFGAFRPEQVTLRVWNQFCNDYYRKNPNKRLINYWSFLGMVMGYAFENGYLDRKWKVENPDPKRKAGRVLSSSEMDALFQHASLDLRDQILFASTMGMRKREHLCLSWEQVNMIERTVTVLESANKNKKLRTVRMSPQVYEMLVRRLGAAGYVLVSPSVFPNPKDPTRPADDNKTAWAAAKRRAGITGRCRYHDLRHTFVTECAKLVRDGQVSVVLICTYIDMSIRVFEKVYLHLNHQDTAAVADLIAVKVR